MDVTRFTAIFPFPSWKKSKNAKMPLQQTELGWKAYIRYNRQSQKDFYYGQFSFSPSFNREELFLPTREMAEKKKSTQIKSCHWSLSPWKGEPANSCDNPLSPWEEEPCKINPK